MSIKEKIKNIFQPRLKLVRGTRFVSFLFIATSVGIAAILLWAANIYYNIDTGEVVTEEIHRITGILRATAGAIVGGTASQNPDSGYIFQVVGKTKLATTTISGGQLEFLGSDTYTGFRAPSSYGTTTPLVYILPQHGTNPPQPDYVLTWQSGNQLQWKSLSGVGGGDITAVGDCASGDCFTQTGGSGNNLWFITEGGGRIQLTGASTASNYTITLPAATGYVALGTGSANAVAYWTGTNTLGYEARLSTTRGGTGADSSSWTGMVRVSGGTWSAYTGTANYAAIWDSNGQFVTAVQYLPVSAGGTGVGSFTQYGILYGNGTNALGVTGAGLSNQLLVSGGGTAAPSWANISDLIVAQNGLTESGTTILTLKLGGALSEDTTLSLGAYGLIFDLTGTGDFRVRDSGVDVFVISDDGRIWFKSENTGYPIAQTGKQILKEVVPIFGFDLPVKTATTSYVKISRDIVNYPLNACESGTQRVHKLVIRYGAVTSTAWQIATSTGSVSTFTLPSTGATSTGSVQTVEVTIPTPSGSCTAWSQGTDTDDWWVRVNPNGEDLMIYQIFLAGYDQIQ